MNHELRTFTDARAAAEGAAELLAEAARAEAGAGRRCTWALSGGRTPSMMFGLLAAMDVPWTHTSVFQVDERVAPDGDANRNATPLLASLGSVLCDFRPMDVTAPDLEDAAARYASVLPDHFDVVHLGLGPDGHTASLVPGDPVLDVTDRLVAPTGAYQGYRRLTLTYPVLDAAALVVWLVTGTDKRDALARLLGGDDSIPAGGVHPTRSIVVADVDASAA